MRFRTTILQTGGTTTGIVVPDDVVEALGQGKKPAVVVTVGGHTYRTTVASRGGQFLMALSSANRVAAGVAGVAGGQEVDVEVEVDTAPRVVEVPADLAVAFEAQPAAKAAWDALSYSHQQQHALSIEGAKAPETRARRVDAAVRKLLGS